MNIVCPECFRILRNGKWVEDILPIDQIQNSLCPQCQNKGDKKESPGKGMAYYQNKRK